MAGGSVGKRKAERRDCYVKAQVQLPGRPAIDCVIINFSATGARARLLTETELPARFKLYIPSRPETKQSLLRWRNGLEFGCEYSTGVADENAFFALVDRVDSIEAALGAAHAAPVTMAATARDDRLDGYEAKMAAGGASPEALTALSTRLAALEAQTAAAPASVDSGLEDRIAQIEARMAATSEPPDSPAIDLATIEKTIEARIADAISRQTRSAQADFDARMAALEQKLAAASEPQTQLFDMQDVEDAIQARLAAITPPEAHPEMVERILKIETELANRPELVFESGAPQMIARPLPDPALIKRIADVEAKVMSLGRAPAVDLSPIERRIDKTEKNAQEYAARVERFLAARIDELELHAISAPTPPAAREADVSELERKLLELSQRFDRQHSLDDVERFSERISNVEMSLLDLRGGGMDDEIRQRIAKLEERNGEVLALLRNVLSLLTARAEQQRVAS